MTNLSDPDAIVSITSNEFTLGAGTYLIRARAPAYRVTRHVIRLYDVTGAAEVEEGENSYTHSADLVATTSELECVVTPGSSNTYRIEHRCETTSASGFGFGVSINGTFTVSKEVYTSVYIEQLA